MTKKTIIYYLDQKFAHKVDTRPLLCETEPWLPEIVHDQTLALVDNIQNNNETPHALDQLSHPSHFINHT